MKNGKPTELANLANELILKGYLSKCRPLRCPGHLNEQADISCVDLEHVILGVAFHREAGDVCIVAAAHNTGILQPQERTQIGLTSSAWLNLAVLEFLVLLGQQFGDGIGGMDVVPEKHSGPWYKNNDKIASTSVNYFQKTSKVRPRMACNIV